MKTFGQYRHESGEVEHIAVPVGEVCLRCEEPIAETDSGVTMPYYGKRGTPPVERAIHVECHIRSFVGSVAHQEMRCPCYGGIDDEVNDGMSRREAARAAVDLFRRTHPCL